MQTILGAGGAIGVELARALPAYTKDIRLVSRDPAKVNPTDQLFPADLTDAAQVARAVEGSEVAYLTVGLPYETKIWESTWPGLMRNVIDACKAHGTRLVFFDNMYMYDPGELPGMTEDAKIDPPSKKGAVRKRLDEMLFEEMEKGNLQALIARSADFYGPEKAQSILMQGVFQNLAAGKKADWLGGLDYRHSFTYTPDAGKATALLGNSEQAFGEVWHLPTAADAPTGREWIGMIARELNAEPKSRVAGKFLVRLMGLFNPLMREFVEMMYQYDRDYVFDSSKFEAAFDLRPTPYEEGVQEIAKKGKF